MPCYNSTVLEAPVDKVWKTVRDFHDLSWADGVITSVEKMGDVVGHDVGARRLVNGVFDETLVSFDEEHHTFSYHLTDGPGPVAQDAVKNYIGTVRLLPVTRGGHTFFEWSTKYEGDEEAIAELCNGIYNALLEKLEEKFNE